MTANVQPMHFTDMWQEQRASKIAEKLIPPLSAAKRQPAICLHRQQNVGQAGFMIETNAIEGNT